MPASQEQKVDFLLKKIGYSASKTGIAEDSNLTGSTKKAPFAEAIPSPLVIPRSSIWSDSGFIPTTPPTSNTTYVGIYTAANAYRMTYDNTVGAARRSFIARSTYGNQTAPIDGDWVDTQFGADYIVKVYKNNPGIGTEGEDYFNLQQAGNAGDDGWFFDYSSGVLNFNGDSLPSGIGTDNVYLVGYRYTGAKGVQPPAGIGTFRDLVVSNNFKVGGISTFSGLIDANGLIEGIAGQNKIPSLYANYSDLPNPGTYHGMFAHVHATGRGYYAHAGNWMELVNKEVNGTVGTGTERYDIGPVDSTSLKVTGITTLGNIGISTGRITGPAITYIDPATVGAAGTVVILGNLQVDGTQTTVNSATMTVTDKNILLAKGAANDAAANTGGITVSSGQGDKTWQWLDGNDSWSSSEHIRVADEKVYGWVDDTNTYIGRPVADKVAFTLGGTESVRITNTGVGINTDPKTYNSSTYQFVVKTHNNANAGITLHSTSSGHGSLLFTDTGGGSAQGQIVYDHSTNRMRFLANAYERMHITTNGAVGIVTTNAENLDSTAHDLVIGKGATGVDAGLTIFTGTDADGKIFFADSISGNDQRRGKIIYGHTDNSMQFATNAVERLRITTNGYLQLNNADSRIYTSANTSILRFGGGSSTSVSNGATLSLTGRTYSGGNYADLASATGGHIQFRIGTSEKVRITSDGKVAIGTTVEGQVSADELTLSGSGTVGMTIRSTNSVESNIFMSDATTGSGEYAGWIKFKHNTTPNRWEFGAVNTQILNILADGKVGINSDAPPTTFDVNGTSQFQDDVTFTGSAGYDTQWDKSANTLKFHNNHYASFGVGDKLTIRHTGVNGYINYNSGALFITPATTNTANYLQLDGGEGLYLKHRFSNGGQSFALKSERSGGVDLYHSGTKKFSTSGIGITVFGQVDTTTLNTGNATFTGTVSAGSTTGTDGYYLKSVGTGVTWAAFPSSRTGLTTTATAGQTSFNFSYNVGFVDVFVNGVKLPSSEFTASNGSTIVLDDAAFANDTLEFISLNTLPVTSAENLSNLQDVNITSPKYGQTLRYNGVKFVNDFHPHATTTSTSQVSITNLPIASYRSAEYLIQVTEGTKYHVTKIIAIHDGTNVTFNEYGTITTHSSLATFTLDINSGNMRLLATPASTNSTTFKVKFDAITV